MSKALVFGASGQLGQCLKKVAAERAINFLAFPEEQDADILNLESLSKLIEKHQPAYCINCAAYTAVDKVTLIHISTDFVFDGDGSTPLTEESKTMPVNVYGQSKLDGEKIIPQYISNYFILRTGWLYSEFANNFVKTMLRLGTERDELKVIADQTGTPTYAIDLAGCILDIIISRNRSYGIYHYSNEGVATWYEFASSIFELAGNNVKVIPIPTSEYPTPARRPKYSVMDKSKIKRIFAIHIPHWRDSLAVCIRRLKS
jgi:dTDP-4-dehydrorhamnose reductase